MQTIREASSQGDTDGGIGWQGAAGRAASCCLYFSPAAAAVLLAASCTPPPDVPPTVLWGDPSVVRERLGEAVEAIEFDREVMLSPCLSPQHYRTTIEGTAAPLLKLVHSLSDEPAKLARFRAELEALIARFTRQNVLQQHFLLTRARKR